MPGKQTATRGWRDAAIEFYNKALALEPNHQIATLYLSQAKLSQQVEDKEAVLKQLSLVADVSAFVLPYINVDPLYDPLSEDPRFQKVLQRMNLR